MISWLVDSGAGWIVGCAIMMIRAEVNGKRRITSVIWIGVVIALFGIAL